MSIHGVLGENTHYPKTYDPTILYPIARQIGRDEIAKTGFAGEYLGVDVWQVFELSWLNPQGISQVAMLRLSIPACSPNIVESKSLKLYFNGLNFCKFNDIKEIKETIQQDISACVGIDVGVAILPLTSHELMICQPVGLCIDGVLDGGDDLDLTDDIDSDVLKNHPLNKTDKQMTYQFYSNLLRSNCPVTNQPDWGTVQIEMTADDELNYGDVLKYILSFRQHNGFHEQCVERIFADFMQIFCPTSLLVQANYTRRGGIDINPVRVFNMPVPNIKRLIRQ